MSQASHQMSLNLQLRDDATLSSFYPGDNAEALQAIVDFSKNTGNSFLYLWGSIGSGRTHLLQATCVALNEMNKQALYVPLESFDTISPLFLQGIETLPFICVDDIHLISKKSRMGRSIVSPF